MSRFLLRGLGAGVVALAVAAGAPVSRDLVLVGFLVSLGLLAAMQLLPGLARAQGGAGESLFERALRRRVAGPSRPAELVRLEDQVRLAVSLASDVHARLRPLVAETAAQRLRSRHGVDLERDPEAARRLLGEEAWELVRPDARPPEDRFARGIPPARLRRILDSVEAL